jgi:flavin-dependent dehydrogenase
MFDYLIVGAGFAGSVLAERMARGLHRKVLLIDRRNQPGFDSKTGGAMVPSLARKKPPPRRSQRRVADV